MGLGPGGAGLGVRVLFCAPAEKDGGDGAQEDVEVEGERPVVNVLEVHLDPVVEVDDFVAPADLP